MSRGQTTWTTGEEQTLRVIAHLGPGLCAETLGKSRWSVKAKAHRLGISLRVTDSRISDTELTPELLDRIRSSALAPVCPACGMRPIGTITGLCGPCHLQRLTAIRLEELDAEIQAKRELWKARQAKHRLRICEACGQPWYPSSESKARHCPACAGFMGP